MASLLLIYFLSAKGLIVPKSSLESTVIISKAQAGEVLTTK